MRTVLCRGRWFLLMPVFVCVGMLSAGEAALAAPGRLTLTTERVVVFKDGYALFVKKATATADAEGRVFTDQVPEGAVLGCFWATGNNKVLSMRAEWDERQEERASESNCISTLELLRANKGKMVKLGLTGTPATVVSGTVIDVLELPPDTKDPALRLAPLASISSSHWSLAEAAMPAAKEVVKELIPRGGSLVAIDTVDQGRLVMPVHEIRTVSGAELVTKMTRRELVSTRSKRLSFDLGKENAGKNSELQIYYFSEGVRWIPTYRVAADKPDKADISLQGEILNEAEDISGAAIDLVVSVPNFRFKTTPSPLALEQVLRSSLSAAAPGLMGASSVASQSYAMSSFSNRASEHLQGGAGEGGGIAALAPELGAGAQADMFVYSARTLSLKKGARATIPLWDSSVVLRNIYTLDMKIARDSRSGYAVERSSMAQPSRSPLKLSENEVWHQFELANSGNVPWTTGAALIMRGNVPLGQELLTYTPLGGKTLLPVTVAINMCGSIKEEELARQQNAMTWDGYQYALVRKKATITVSNFRTEKSVTRVTVAIGGKAEKPSNEGIVKLNDSRPEDWQNGDWRGVNNHSDVSWDLEMAPGEIKTLTFEFSFYIR